MTASPIRIRLSAASSAALTAAGHGAFTIVHKVMRTEEPDSAGRWEITLAPIEWQTAVDASAVLLGTRRVRPLAATARRVKPSPAPSPTSAP